jgi:hypothetical protein
MKTPEGKYRNGEHVIARCNPGRTIVVRRYVDYIYYCIDEARPNDKDLAYFERELSALT